MAGSWTCSPDGAWRNPGHMFIDFPDSGAAYLHPGYGADEEHEMAILVMACLQDSLT